MKRKTRFNAIACAVHANLLKAKNGDQYLIYHRNKEILITVEVKEK